MRRYNIISSTSVEHGWGREIKIVGGKLATKRKRGTWRKRTKEIICAANLLISFPWFIVFTAVEKEITAFFLNGRSGGAIHHKEGRASLDLTGPGGVV